MTPDTRPFKVFVLPNGNRIGIGQYVSAWKTIKTLPPGTELPGWNHFTASASEILREMSYGVHDRINRRAGITLGKPMSHRRIMDNLRRTVKCECRWCGSPLAEYQPLAWRFCEGSCRRAYYC